MAAVERNGTVKVYDLTVGIAHPTGTVAAGEGVRDVFLRGGIGADGELSVGVGKDAAGFVVEDNAEVAEAVAEDAAFDFAGGGKSGEFSGCLEGIGEDEGGINHALLGGAEMAAFDGDLNLPEEVDGGEEEADEEECEDFPMEAVERRRDPTDETLDEIDGAPRGGVHGG